MTLYTSKQGDMVDEICQAYYGRTSGAVEAVYEANNGLADLGPVLEAGVSIVLPDVPEPKTARATLY